MSVIWSSVHEPKTVFGLDGNAVEQVLLGDLQDVLHRSEFRARRAQDRRAHRQGHVGDWAIFIDDGNLFLIAKQNLVTAPSFSSRSCLASARRFERTAPARGAATPCSGRHKKKAGGGDRHISVDATLEGDIAQVEQSVADYLNDPTDDSRAGAPGGAGKRSMRGRTRATPTENR